MVVVVIRDQTSATARWTSLFIVRAFVNDTITVAVWTGFHLCLHSSRWQRNGRGAGGWQPSINRCCILSAKDSGRTRRCWRRCGRWCSRRWSATGRSRLGSSTTPAFPSRGCTRLAWRGNIAASSANRTIVRLRSRCRLPITTQACRWPIACICRKTGRRTANAGAKRAFLRTSASRPSRRSRSSSCAGPVRPAFLAAWC